MVAVGRAARPRPDHRPPPLRLHVEPHAELLADVRRVQRRRPGPLQQLVVAGERGELKDVVVAGAGEATAPIFDINHAAIHALACALGILGLAIAALLIGASLGRVEPWPSAR
jgi:hypothetical protein